ncbi:MAG TPA: hypothetical protein VNV15_00255 [Opitutaceae bacterium]|nr:hypothetical protein [Opitutaceae bacterium]
MWILAWSCLFSAEARSDTAALPPEPGFLGFMDRLPEFVNTNLPFFAPRGSYWFYARPRIGDPFKGKYFRLDAGMWVKVTKSVDFNIGAQSFVWRDQTVNDATRWGFNGATTGIKYNRCLSGPIGTAMSVGVNFSTPIDRPPPALSDGFRRTDPFLTYTRPLSVRLHLVGFASFGADMLAHTSLPNSYGKNALHSNSLNGAVGATREFKCFTVTTSLNAATTALMSKHALQVFSLNPEVTIPAENIFPRLCAKLPHWHINLNLSAHAITGPDGQQYGVSSSVSVNFTSRPGH